MGYALFASRKIYYQSMINNLNVQIDNIVQEKSRLLSFSAGIADGKITVDELAQDPSNLNRYMAFIEGSDAYKKNEDGGGKAVGVIGGFLAGNEKEYTQADVAVLSQLLDESLGSEYAKSYDKRVTAAENQLDLQQKRLETKLEAMKNQLQSVEQAEAQAIQRAVPKFAGLG